MTTGRISLRRGLCAAAVAILATDGVTMLAAAAMAHEIGKQSGVAGEPGNVTGHRPESVTMTPPVDPSGAALPAVWWMILNNPAYCGGLCGIDDLTAAESATTIFYAVGLGDPGDLPADPRPEVRVEHPRPGAESWMAAGDCGVAPCADIRPVTFMPNE